MKKLTLAFIAILGMTMTLNSCKEKNVLLGEWDTPFGIPPYEKIKVTDYIPAIKEGIKQQKAEIEAIINNPEPATFENTSAAYELSGQLLNRTVGVLYNLVETDATDELNKVHEEATELLTAHGDEISMNKKLFERVKAVYEGDQSNLTREQQMVLKKHYQAFTRNGVNLDEASQTELKEINKKLAAAQNKFGNNLLAENNKFKEEFGISVSAYSETMATCGDRSLREKMYKAYSQRGNNNNEYDNKALCLEILKLRARKAQLLGFENFAAYQLDNKMAHDPATVDAFLDKIITPAIAKAKEELSDMQKLAGFKIEPWDWMYYAEKVRSVKYNLNEEQTKPYFRMENVRKGIFYAANLIYGVSAEPLKNVPLYNPAVETFKITDADGSLLGIFTTDYFPRSSKRGGAWMNNVRDQYVNAKGEDVRPIIENVGNFSAPSDSLGYSLLTVDNVETMFHEFGHALHGLLTKCHYPSVSGTSVARDFVETFSQFNENWAFQPEILAKYALHHKTGEVIPDSLVAKINNASKFNQGFMTAELAAASILDMKWHELSLSQLDSVNISDFEKSVCSRMGLIGEIIPRYKTTYFNHIFNSGYSAGYYSYLWAEVLDKDAFEYFEQNGIYNKEIALKFRKTFLEKGGSEEPMTLYEQFRGAEPDPGALLRARGL